MKIPKAINPNNTINDIDTANAIIKVFLFLPLSRYIATHSLLS